VKKILAVIGSPNDEKSNTATLARDFLDAVRQFCPEEMEYEVISLGKRKIEYCRGCCACMLTGTCVYKEDALQEITRKIMESDMLIIGSPVYELQVSAQIKAFFDRTFMWIHLIGLMGKPAVTAVTTGGDSVWLTEKYLSSAMSMMGCIMVGHIWGKGSLPGVFPDRERCRAKYKKVARKVADLLCERRKVKPKIFNRLCFFLMKIHTRRVLESKTLNDKYKEYEHKHWQKKGWFNLSYKKALEKERANNLRTIAI
jgi:multimeric flavodoxin WrbA